MVVVPAVAVLAVVAACDHSEFGAVVLGSAGCNAKNRNHPTMDRVMDSFS
jgi:hypothetical protein